MFVTEYDYDDDVGHIVEQRELRDVSTTTDSLIRKYEYSTWNAALGGVHLLNETTVNRLGRTYENIDYQNSVDGQWRTRVRHDAASSATRSEKRTFSRHASFFGTWQGAGIEGELGIGLTGTLNIDPNAQSLAGPLSYLNATAWQRSGGVGVGGGYFLHQTQTNKISYSQIQPYVTAPQQAWQWATGP